MKEEFAALFNLLKADEETGDKMFAGDDIHMKSVAPYGIPSGIPQLDLFLGRKGGLPASKIIEYYGAPASGKTTAAMHAGAEWQRRGGLVFFLDTEQSFTPGRAREIGMRPEDIIKSEPETIEETASIILDALEKLEKADFDKPVLFIVDSVTGVPTVADAEGNLENAERPGHEAKVIKRALKKINTKLGALKCKPSIIFINHIHSKIVSWGKTSDSSGGKGIKFYASVRVEFAQVGMLKDKANDVRLGHKTKCTIEKLKGAHLEYPNFEVSLTNESGFDKVESLQTVMVSTGYADKPKSSQVITILPGTDQEEQFKTKDILDWIEQKGGYETVYAAWRKHAVDTGVLIPWGTGE